MRDRRMHSPGVVSKVLARRLRTVVVVAAVSTALLASGALTGAAEAVGKPGKSSRISKAKKAKKPVKPQARKKSNRSSRQHTRRATDPTKLALPPVPPSPVLDAAAQYIGRPYRFGAADGSYDCSGFTRSVFAEIGVDLPHSARAQFSCGDQVRRDELEPGDLVFFRIHRRDASHVGIYVGDDKFVHAATRGGQVQVDSLSQEYYAVRYVGARRVSPEG